jgi:murein L,D-transpeptidase YafK
MDSSASGRRRLLLAGLGLTLVAGAGVAWPVTGRTVLARAGVARGDRAAAAASRQGPALRALLHPLGLDIGAPVFLRILKEPSLLEVFVDTGTRFSLLAAYPICRWSGTLGPKQREGDGQAPEGYYTVRRGQLNPYSAYHLSFDLGYPNAYDRAHRRTGSALMVHGSCVSIGCYAMTDEGIEAIYTLIAAALDAGQDAVRVHALPFRLTTPDAAARIDASPWKDLWTDLRDGELAFERTGRPPRISVRNRRYVVS